MGLVKSMSLETEKKQKSMKFGTTWFTQCFKFILHLMAFPCLNDISLGFNKEEVTAHTAHIDKFSLFYLC